MKNKKGLIILIGFILFVIVALFIYFAFFTKEDNFIKSIIDNDKSEPIVSGINDNYNGVYSNIENIGQTINAFDGCTFSYISNYVLVNGDTYKVFRSSCIGTFFLESGETKNLKFIFNEKTKLYDLEYNHLLFNKDLSVGDIKITNKEFNSVKIDYYKFVLKEVKYSNNFSRLTAEVGGYDGFKVLFNDGIYNVTLNSINGIPLYNYSTRDINNLPDVNVLNGDSIIFEKNVVNGSFNDRLFVYSKNGIKYNLMSHFPIVVDGVTLDSNSSILLNYNVNKKKYVMYVGYDENICAQDSLGDRIVYYEFDLEYDYYNKTFKKPYFISFGKGSQGCKTIKEIIKKR